MYTLWKAALLRPETWSNLLQETVIIFTIRGFPSARRCMCTQGCGLLLYEIVVLFWHVISHIWWKESVHIEFAASTVFNALSLPFFCFTTVVAILRSRQNNSQPAMMDALSIAHIASFLACALKLEHRQNRTLLFTLAFQTNCPSVLSWRKFLFLTLAPFYNCHISLSY